METDLLAQLVDAKRDVLAQLVEISHRQMDIAAEGDLAPLLRLLASKQTLLDRLMEIEKRLEPFREQQPEDRIWRSEAARARCARAAEQCEQLLREILEKERQGEALLVERRDRTSQQLDAAANAMQARRAYAGENQELPHALDVSSET